MSVLEKSEKVDDFVLGVCVGMVELRSILISPYLARPP